MRCPYCKKRIKENGNVCEHCGKELTLLTKYRGQHVRKKDIFQIDTLIGMITTVLLIVVLFLPVCEFHGADGSVTLSLWQGFSQAGAAMDRNGLKVWFLILYLVFTCIFCCAWFWGEKSDHYFWIAVSGMLGCWIMGIICTFFMVETCVYFGYSSLSATPGFFVWFGTLLLQVVSVILYRWRTRCLIRQEMKEMQTQEA